MSKDRLTEQELLEIEQRAERVNLDRLNPFDKEIIADLLCLVTEVRQLRESLHEIANVDEGHSSIDCNIMRDLARRALGGE